MHDFGLARHNPADGPVVPHDSAAHPYGRATATPANEHGMQIDVIGVPLDYGAGRRGVDMGP
ncbi:MAG: hypothetical protein KY444_06280, partial [Gemmatimonadetes bacterium]|nr:hypothetical protein [Gemmatimonadota bacterium]